MPLPRNTMFRLSMRELLVVVALVGVGLSSLMYATPAWRTLIGWATMATYMGVAILAVVDRGPRQAFAMGMALTITLYAVIVINGGERRGGNRELDPQSGHLPTTRAARYFYDALTLPYFYDSYTGVHIPDYDPQNPPTGAGVILRSRGPEPGTFMAVAHCWWALIFGYAGGHFARFVYWRRLRDEQKLPAETS